MAKEQEKTKIENVKKVKQTKKKKTKKVSYFKEVKAEMKKVTFPSAKDVFKYTMATIVIVAFLIGFFLCLSALLSWIKEVF